MSTIIVEFPDCARLGSQEAANPPDGKHDTITIFTQECPAVIEGPPPLFPWWSFVLGAAILLVAIITTGIVRFRAHERKEDERRRELEAQVAMAKAQKTCGTCGADYKPEVRG